mmetsp:Transcript_14407/g.41056  ORF Transcript_14407/g.41056 Transcript_14407/m.41056 type:complete len:289 (+) Transcript_14407:305-1171(+)
MSRCQSAGQLVDLGQLTQNPLIVLADVVVVNHQHVCQIVDLGVTFLKLRSIFLLVHCQSARQIVDRCHVSNLLIVHGMHLVAAIRQHRLSQVFLGDALVHLAGLVLLRLHPEASQAADPGLVEPVLLLLPRDLRGQGDGREQEREEAGRVGRVEAGRAARPAPRGSCGLGRVVRGAREAPVARVLRDHEDDRGGHGGGLEAVREHVHDVAVRQQDVVHVELEGEGGGVVHVQVVADSLPQVTVVWDAFESVLEHGVLHHEGHPNWGRQCKAALAAAGEGLRIVPRSPV